MQENPNPAELLSKFKANKFKKESFLDFLSWGKEYQTVHCEKELEKPTKHFKQFAEALTHNDEIIKLLERYDLKKYILNFYFLLFYACGDDHPQIMNYMRTRCLNIDGEIDDRFRVNSREDELDKIVESDIDNISFRIKHKNTKIIIDNTWIITRIKKLIKGYKWEQSDLGPTHILGRVKQTYLGRLIANECFDYFSSLGKSKNISEILCAWVLYLSGKLKLAEAPVESQKKDIRSIKTKKDLVLQQAVKGYFKKNAKSEKISCRVQPISAI